MPYICYRKTDLSIVGYSGTIADPNHTGEKEIELNVLPNFGGTLDDYGYIEITDEQEIERQGKPCVIRLDENGTPRLVILPQSLDVIKEQKIAELNELCEQTILAGFTSQTTGHFYRFNEYDQMNFTQQMLLLLADPGITEVAWKTEDAGVITHTRENFLAVTREAEVHKRGLMERYWALKAQVLAATTKEEVDAVNW